MTRRIISANSPLSPRGHPALRPSITTRVGPAIEKWLFSSRFPATAVIIECLSFSIARVKSPRTRLSLTFEGSIHFYSRT